MEIFNFYSGKKYLNIAWASFRNAQIALYFFQPLLERYVQLCNSRKVKVSNGQEMSYQKEFPVIKTEVGKNLIDNQVPIQREHIWSAE